MPTAIFILGIVLTLAGLALIVLAKFERPAPPAPQTADVTTQSLIGDIGEIIDKFNAMLDKIEQRYRIGLIVMALGVSLIGTGAYLEAKEAKDEAKSSSAMSAFVGR